ncbi:MAG: RNA methyltransferase [Bacteroidetes bacterium]|nr:RNA methyltransferase [Bacteroidota bacterium]
MTRQITSLQNPFIKNLLLLQEKPRARKEQDLFVIEGVREVRLAVTSGFKLTELVYCRELLAENELETLVSLPGVSFGLTEVPPEVYNRLAYRKDQGGMMALAIPRRTGLEELKLNTNPLLLVLESVEKPGNLGALLRTADAANLDAVIICDPQTDIYNPNAIRSSIGCIFTIPVVTCTSQEAIAWLRSNRIRMFGTALSAIKFYHETDLTGPAAIIMGSEAFGLSSTWLDESDERIKIPMNGKIDSLNVSTSAAIVVFEALRQRNFK